MHTFQILDYLFMEKEKLSTFFYGLGDWDSKLKVLQQQQNAKGFFPPL